MFNKNLTDFIYTLLLQYLDPSGRDRATLQVDVIAANCLLSPNLAFFGREKVVKIKYIVIKSNDTPSQHSQRRILVADKPGQCFHILERIFEYVCFVLIFQQILASFTLKGRLRPQYIDQFLNSCNCPIFPMDSFISTLLKVINTFLSNRNWGEKIAYQCGQ